MQSNTLLCAVSNIGDKMNFSELHHLASQKLNPRDVSPFISAGGVASAILTEDGNVYLGICIDTACTLGMCAERNAIANMLTNGESRIIKLVCVTSWGTVGSPCGACREYLMQLHKDNGQMEILLDLDSSDTITLNELIPDWWGHSRFEQACS